MNNMSFNSPELSSLAGTKAIVNGQQYREAKNYKIAAGKTPDAYEDWKKWFSVTYIGQGDLYRYHLGEQEWLVVNPNTYVFTLTPKTH